MSLFGSIELLSFHILRTLHFNFVWIQNGGRGVSGMCDVRPQGSWWVGSPFKGASTSFGETPMGCPCRGHVCRNSLGKCCVYTWGNLKVLLEPIGGLGLYYVTI